MALELSVPAIAKQAAASTEANPQAVQGLLAALPFARPALAAQTVLPSLQALNRAQIASDLRMQLLELYRHAVLDIVQSLAAQYYNAVLPLPDKVKEAAQLVKQLLIELAYGYKQALLNRGRGLFGSSKQLPLMVHRTMDALSRQLISAYQTYTPQPPSVWSELHQLYVFAVQQKLLNNQTCDIGTVYKQALLLYLADPRHLVPGDVDRVHEYLSRHADLAQLQPLSEQAEATGVFLVNLTADEPPGAWVKHKSADARTDILLITRPLTARLQTQWTRLQENDAPNKLDLPPAALDAHYQDLLAHLLRHWTLAPKRVFPRSARQGDLNVCIGLADLHYFLNGKELYLPPEHAETTEITLTSKGAAPIGGRPAASGVSSRWGIINESAGGLALAKLPGTPASLRLGALIGLKPDQGRHWGIAAVRWVSLDAHDGLSMGTQMLAPHAEAVLVRDEGDGRCAQALLLPAMEALKQPSSLIMLPGHYAPARVLALEGRGRRLLITRLMERTTGFERFQFSDV